MLDSLYNYSIMCKMINFIKFKYMQVYFVNNYYDCYHIPIHEHSNLGLLGNSMELDKPKAYTLTLILIPSL